MERSKRSKRRIELELRKTQREADAARLDAKAAELELRLDRMEDAPSLDSGATTLRNHEVARSESSRGDSAPAVAPAPTGLDEAGSANGAGPAHWKSWSDMRRSVRKTEPANGTRSDSKESVAKPLVSKVQRTDGAHALKPPTLGDFHIAGSTNESERHSSDKTLRGFDVDEQDGDSEGRTRRRKPAAVFISAIAHGVLLLVLACFTLSTHRPGDQVAIAGSVEDTDEVAIESLEIEAAEMEPQETETTPTLAEYEISDVGEIFVPELSSDAIATVPAIENMLTDSSSSAAAQSLKSSSDSTSQFCGVEGGGNHFVYLVDSSGSMGDAFDSARQELLRSIEALGPKQRFYVVFFDSESDYMRLASPNVDEPRSVYATPENKRALARWAMSIQMDRGRAPYDAIPFALDLRPDAIFLLSDGEFPQRIEDLLKETNRIDNLFGDDGPISIVHTISYHSREGESRMKRIAKQNGGQYRHVPKP
ncbi:MAG: vWA domain-containing protein [Planctomycetota bacterium]